MLMELRGLDCPLEQCWDHCILPAVPGRPGLVWPQPFRLKTEYKMRTDFALLVAGKGLEIFRDLFHVKSAGFEGPAIGQAGAIAQSSRPISVDIEVPAIRRSNTNGPGRWFLALRGCAR